MKEVLALGLVLSLLIPSTALAAPADESTNTPASAPSLRAQAAKAAADEARSSISDPARVNRTTLRPSTATAPVQNGKKSFWKTPWPYVIIGAAVVVAVVAA